jgi:hypothetical protein
VLTSLALLGFPQTSQVRTDGSCPQMAQVGVAVASLPGGWIFGA